MMHYSHDDDLLASLLSMWIDLTYVTQTLNPLSPKGPPIYESNHLALDKVKSISGTIGS